MIAETGAHGLAIVAVILWVAIALGVTLVAIRRASAGGRALDEAHTVADLLAGSPAAPMLVYENGAVDADPRVAEWVGLAETPTRLTDFAAVLDTGDAAALADAVTAVRTVGRTVSLQLALAGTDRWVELRGAPYSVAGRSLDAVLLWLLDVTAPQQQAGRLRAQLERLGRAIDGLSALIEAAPFPIWQRTPDLHLALVNGAYVRALEADSAEQVVTQGMELLDGSRDGHPQASAAQARDRDGPLVYTAPAIIAGERRLMRVVDVPIGEAGVAGYAIDVQEMEDAHAELGLFVQAQRDMLDRLSAAVVQFAADRSLVFHNRQFTALFAMAPEWLADRPEFDRVLDRMREAERAPESRDFPGWRAGRRAWFGSTEPVEESWQLPGGTHLRVVAQPLPDRGLLVIFEDRTEHLRLASARDTLLRVRTATFDNLFEAVGVFAADGRLQLWNHRFGALWDIAEDELARRPRVDTLAQALAPKLADPSRATLLRDTVRIATHDRQQRSGRMSLRDGRHYEFAAVPLPDGNALFTLLDITAARENEEALRARNDALEEANRLKNAFVARMSYELRVPLTSIAGFAEMLAGGYAGELTETARDYVGSISSAVERLSALTSDVLDLTQSEIGSLPMEMETLDLGETVRAMLDRARATAWSAGLTLVADVPSDCGRILGDRRRLAQALDHLLRNAISYTPADGRVLVRVRSRDRTGEVTLSDNGRGIAPQQRERILDRMRRSSLGDAGERDGRAPLGFGLPLAYQLIETHGGTLALESEPGQGTTVTVELPLLAEDA